MQSEVLGLPKWYGLSNGGQLSLSISKFSSAAIGLQGCSSHITRLAKHLHQMSSTVCIYIYTSKPDPDQNSVSYQWRVRLSITCTVYTAGKKVGRQ